MDILVIFLTVFGLDFVTKSWVRLALPKGAEIGIFPFFNLSHVENTGIAFGLFPGKNLIFIILGIAISGVIFAYIYWKKPTQRLVRWSLGLVLGGAWGNLLDRILLGRVTDFLDFFVGSYHWPAFNVADSAICVGAFLIFIQSFLPSSPSS